MPGTKRESLAGSRPARADGLRPFGLNALAWSILPAAFLSMAAIAPAAQAATSTAATPAAATSAASATARIQALLDHPVGGTVNLPRGTFTVRPTLLLHQGERIVGHGTTLRVASGSGSYHAMLAGASATTDLSGLAITGVTFDQNAAGNPIRSAAVLYQGSPRFVVQVDRGSDVKIANDRFIGTDNVNTIVTGGATSNVTISGNAFRVIDAPMHDHSSIYTSGIGTVISGNTFTGSAAYATAIEVHGDRVRVTGNRVSGYYKAANIVAADTLFRGNHVSGAANPVDLWSIAPTALRNVTITGNVLNRNEAYWKSVLARLGRRMPAPRYTRQVIREATSTLPFYNITVRGNSR
jgi:hypothetical protein